MAPVRLADMPLKRKLTAISMLASGVALLLACATFVTYEVMTFKDALVADMYGHAAIIGHNSAAALLFDDPSSAESTLESFSTQPQVAGSVLYDRRGSPFALYRHPDLKEAFVAPPARPTEHSFDGDRLKLFYEFAVAGEPVGTVYIETNIESLGARIARYGLIGLLVMTLASGVAFLLSTRLQRTISGPISALETVVTRVRTEHDYSLRAQQQGKDELGRLIEGFNAMLDQIQAQDHALQEARDHLEHRVIDRTRELEQEVAERKSAQAELEQIHEQLVTASRQAGMAEVATNVLHNVGNVLNSVNVSSSVLEEQAVQSRVVNLQRLAALLEEHAQDLGEFLVNDPRGKQIPAYLSQLSEHLLAERAVTLKELQSLRNNIDHIKGIVTMQQSYSKVAGIQENTDVVDLLEDALRINNASLERHDVEIVRDYAKVPVLNTEKHKVLQILVNLVRNAKDACKASAREDKRITLRVRNGDDRVKLSVVDNGVGIAPENMTRIFAHGFTTKKDGHGFGLHSGALAARELGGTLLTTSAGVDCGATFTLELPFEPQRN